MHSQRSHHLCRRTQPVTHMVESACLCTQAAAYLIHQCLIAPPAARHIVANLRSFARLAASPMKGGVSAFPAARRRAFRSQHHRLAIPRLRMVRSLVSFAQPAASPIQRCSLVKKTVCLSRVPSLPLERRRPSPRDLHQHLQRYLRLCCQCLCGAAPHRTLVVQRRSRCHPALLHFPHHHRPWPCDQAVALSLLVWWP